MAPCPGVGSAHSHLMQQRVVIHTANKREANMEEETKDKEGE